MLPIASSSGYFVKKQIKTVRVLTRKGLALQKNFIEQKVLRIIQRKRVNFFRIFWSIFGFFKKMVKSKKSKMAPKILQKFTHILWLILSTFYSIKFFCKANIFRVKN